MKDYPLPHHYESCTWDGTVSNRYDCTCEQYYKKYLDPTCECCYPNNLTPEEGGIHGDIPDTLENIEHFERIVRLLDE